MQVDTGGCVIYTSNVAGRQPKRLDADALMNYALRALGSRAQSSGELKQKLARRAEHPGDIDTVLAKLRDLGYLNDRSYAEGYASARLENQGHGRTRVLRDLRQRRVAPKLAEQAVERAFAETDELGLIDAYLKRKFRGKNLPVWLSEEKNLASAYRRLRYAGFSTGNSIRVLKRYAAKADDLEGIEEPGQAEEE
jgi:regulatory protein